MGQRGTRDTSLSRVTLRGNKLKQAPDWRLAYAAVVEFIIDTLDERNAERVGT